MENNTNPRGFFGVIIPIKLLDNPDLTSGEKIVYAYIASYRKACFDTNERIAQKTGTPERTVQRAIANLTKLGFIAVEFANNNSAKRRIYAVMDEPKKLAYLAKKGLIKTDIDDAESFPQGVRQNGAPSDEVRQNGVVARQNGAPQNRGEVRQNGAQRIIEENKNKAPDAAGPVENRPSNVGAPRPMRKNFKTNEEYEKALYAWSA